jgi:hypothetical protein
MTLVEILALYADVELYMVKMEISQYSSPCRVSGSRLMENRVRTLRLDF